MLWYLSRASYLLNRLYIALIVILQGRAKKYEYMLRFYETNICKMRCLEIEDGNIISILVYIVSVSYSMFVHVEGDYIIYSYSTGPHKIIELHYRLWVIITQNAYCCQYIIWHSMKFVYDMKSYSDMFSIENVRSKIYIS